LDQVGVKITTKYIIHNISKKDIDFKDLSFDFDMSKDSMKLNVSGIAGAAILNTIIDTIKKQFCDQIIEEITENLSEHLQSLPDSIR
jgi:hypothetical protein